MNRHTTISDYNIESSYIVGDNIKILNSTPNIKQGTIGKDIK